MCSACMGFRAESPEQNIDNIHLVRCGSILSKKGFVRERQATLIQERRQTRNLDSKIASPRFDNFKIQFHISNLDTFSTASVIDVVF